MNEIAMKKLADGLTRGLCSLKKIPAEGLDAGGGPQHERAIRLLEEIDRIVPAARKVEELRGRLEPQGPDGLSLEEIAENRRKEMFRFDKELGKSRRDVELLQKSLEKALLDQARAEKERDELKASSTLEEQARRSKRMHDAEKRWAEMQGKYARRSAEIDRLRRFAAEVHPDHPARRFLSEADRKLADADRLEVQEASAMSHDLAETEKELLAAQAELEAAHERIGLLEERVKELETSSVGGPGLVEELRDERVRDLEAALEASESARASEILDSTSIKAAARATGSDLVKIVRECRCGLGPLSPAAVDRLSEMGVILE